MDFEKIKAALLEQDFEGYLFDTPLDQIAADIERKAEEMDRRNKREDLKRILGCILVYVCAGILYSTNMTLIGGIGVALFVLGTTLQFISYLTLHFKFREVRYDLPYKQFLEEERKRILARISALKLITSLYLVPIALGIILYGYPKMFYGTGLIVLIAAVVIAVIGTVLQGRRRIHKYLMPYLVEVDGEIAKIDALPA
jgi:hypothetical protein